MDFLWHSVFFVLLVVRGINSQSQTPQRTIYDFEDPAHLTAFSSSPPASILTTVTSIYKNGDHSMEWAWASRAEITHSIYPPIQGSELNEGGIKLWLYITRRRAGENLTVSFADQSGTTVSQFHINLNFTGWRAVWVSYRESSTLGSQLRDITTMKITAPTTTQPIHPLYFDQLRLVGKMRQQTRDKIVPPIMPQQYSAVNNWQQTYNWSQVNPPNILSGANPDRRKLNDLTLIEKRLDNWFVKQSLPSTRFRGNVRDRWISLKDDVEKSHRKFNRLRHSQHGVITGPPLYSRDSEFRNKKFSDVMKAVLLPMALDYHIRSRQSEVNAVAAAELQNLIAGGSVMNASIQTIAGDDARLQQTFNNSLNAQAQPYDVTKVQNAIQALNNERERRLKLLLDYIENQGFTDGSGLGSLNHEMNKDGAGFMNSVYLLRNVLQGVGKTSDYIATMKWYNEFGEVYQNPFPYNGTNADRLRTISIFRLFTVLMMPTSSRSEQLAKIRDMEALVNWYRNALSPNEAFGGVFKPDYLGFHHNGYYASAYTPNAVHTAALILYLLSGTSFDLGIPTRRNLRNGLSIMRVVSVKYSSPNSVSGRFPGFFREILATNFPAYAYITAIAPNYVSGSSSVLGQIAVIEPVSIGMFMRLYNRGDRAVNEYLTNGRIFTSIYYLNSIGSISIIEEIYNLARTRRLLPEPSPKGFWALNYAALVIHRREDWAVSVKGFNKFVWDFEASTTQNCYGLYQSHGALLIANNEEALRVYDIENGWDWTRHPGTTTIKMDFDNLVSKDRRYFQPKKLAGGVRLVGAGRYATGAFGMEFSQPSGYRWQTAGAFQGRISFTFQKSVFFADSLIVCLGSDISATHSLPTDITQTTLFQTKLLDPAVSRIYINRTVHLLSGTDVNKGPNYFGSGNVAAFLLDVNDNGYYIPKAGDQGLNVKISNQISRDQNGTQTLTNGRYGAAWLDHGVNPSNKNYEYAIIVRHRRVLPDIYDMLTRQQGNDPVYRVLHHDSMAHVVEFPNSPRVGATQYGYVFFDESARTLGPVYQVSKAPCLVMVEENSHNLYVSVSSPDLNFNITQMPSTSPKLDAQERFYSVSQGVNVKVFLRREFDLNTAEVRVDNEVIEWSQKNNHVEVVPRSSNPLKGAELMFKVLKKGFSTEVKLTGSTTITI